MIEHNFKNSCEFAKWKADKEIYNMEYLGTLSGKKCQVCFEVDIENEGTQLVCINKSANELFFISQVEMDDWMKNNNAMVIVNNGYSDLFVGYNEFQCKVADIEISCYIDATALI